MRADLLLWALADAIYAHKLKMAHASPYYYVRARRTSDRLGEWRMTWLNQLEVE